MKTEKKLKRILRDLAILQKASAIAKDKVRMGAVKELIVTLKTGDTTINIKNLKGGINV